MRLLAWLRLWIGVALAASGGMAVVVKIGSVVKLPGAIDWLFHLLMAPGTRLMGALSCEVHGRDCLTLPSLLVFCLISGAFWATVIIIAAWALAGIRGK